MSKETIKYLIKFTTEKSHAEDLLNGHLFMRPSVAYVKMFYDEFFKSYNEFTDENFADYVRNYKGCIGDFTEARLIGGQDIKANTNIPIFCLSYITSSQVDNEKFTITFTKKQIDEFICSGYKYAVLIRFDKFEAMLLDCMNNKNIIGGFGPVKYSNLKNMEDIKDCFTNMKYGKNLLYKNPYFSGQKEFRIFSCQAKERYTHITYKDSFKLYKTDLNDLQFKNAVELKELPYFIENVDSIKEYSKIYEIKDFISTEENYYLQMGTNQ